MRRLKTINWSLIVFAFVIFVALVGTTTGTLAWYAYVTRVTLTYTGTSVSKSERLQVGLVDDSEYFDEEALEYFDLSREQVGAHSLVFSKPGAGLNGTIISAYLSHTSFASNTVSPVTSRGIEIDGDLTLYDCLTSHYSLNEDEANPNRYVKIPFAFRVIDANDLTIPNQHVWVTAMEATSSANVNTHHGLRAYFENINENKSFLVNPSSRENTAGATRVAGVLDLDNDGFYDSDHGKEIVYGDFDPDSVSYSDVPYPLDEEHAPIVDVNGVGNLTPSTFVAKHKQGVYVADISNIDADFALYDTLTTIKPDDSGSGEFSGGKPVTYTNQNGIGYCDLSVYLEGWDFAVVDRIIGTKFNLGIQFEIKKQ